MKIFTDKLTYTGSYPLTAIGDPAELLFVDIETTGFSATSATIYAIGCITFDGAEATITQYFAETPAAELEVLRAFFTLCQDKKVLIHFNGNTFDIPFLKKRAAAFSLPTPLDDMDGVDIFKRIAPYKDLLGLPNCKQKSIEEFLGIHREDAYNGGQLVEIYKEYVTDQDSEKERLLCLHNHDDMKGMLSLLPMLTYTDLFFVPFKVASVRASRYQDETGAPKEEVIMKLRFHTPFPKGFSMQANDCYFSAKGSEGFLKVPLYRGELKYFYANYKDYYYLPLEDMALHKSVASFVDKAYRKQAKASTCYTRQESVYLPQWDILFEPIFKKSYDDKMCYFELTEEKKRQPELFRQYATHLVDMMAHCKD